MGGQKNVDLGNVPIVLTPNQVRDGSIHALTCIGPATKEMTRHYIREPLVEGLANDDELDLIGVVFVGSPQVNDEKLWVSDRLGSLLESLDIDGRIITTEGFGNNHIDFIQHIGQAGKRGHPRRRRFLLCLPGPARRRQSLCRCHGRRKYGPWRL